MVEFIADVIVQPKIPPPKKKTKGISISATHTIRCNRKKKAQNSANLFIRLVLIYGATKGYLDPFPHLIYNLWGQIRKNG